MVTVLCLALLGISSAWLGWMRLHEAHVVAPACTHAGAVPVRSIVDGEVLAWLCLKCDKQLGPEWGLIPDMGGGLLARRQPMSPSNPARGRSVTE